MARRTRVVTLRTVSDSKPRQVYRCKVRHLSQEPEFQELKRLLGEMTPEERERTLRWCARYTPLDFFSRSKKRRTKIFRGNSGAKKEGGDHGE